MDSRKIVFKETSVIAIGEAICVPLMVLAFFLCGAFDRTVVFGGIAGALIATANFFFMAMSTSLAADKALAEDVKGGHKLLSNIEKGEVWERVGPTRWQCRNCGAIVEGEKAPEVCPVCFHKKAYFQLEAANY